MTQNFEKESYFWTWADNANSLCETLGGSRVNKDVF